MISKPRCFLDLLELQKILDDEVSKPRENGFEPRKRNKQDILSALDDEFQEWLRELPQECNFKTWKQKEYDVKKELEELTDVLFFILQYTNDEEDQVSTLEELENAFNMDIVRNISLEDLIKEFKNELWSTPIIDYLLGVYMQIVQKRGFTKKDLLNAYWDKWQINMGRQNKDWVIQE